MTDEEKAEEYLKCEFACGDYDRENKKCIFKNKCEKYKIYLDGLAEGRKEKMLAYAKNHGKLTKEKIELIEALKDKDRQLNNWYLSYNEVLKENAELKAHRDRLINLNLKLAEEKEKQKAQIEKMKCCGNCKHYKQPNNYLVGTCKGKYGIEGNNICNEWELAE